MTRSEIVATTHAPAAIGPYSQAVISGEFVISSGQIALDPTTGALVGDDVATQTRQVFANLRAVLDKAGCALEDVIKTTVFLIDMEDFAAMNAVYAGAFGRARPARSTVAVAGLPRGARVEIEVLARRS